MNLLFQHSHKYDIDRPAEQVEARLRSIVTRRWDDYSMDIVGFIKKDGQFCITNKWGITRKFRGLDNKAAHMTGQLLAGTNETRTALKIKTGPNRSLVVLFYILLAISLIEFLGVEPLVPVHSYIKSGFFLATSLVLLLLLQSHKRALINRFEDLMQLRVPAEEINLAKENLLAS
jgi:hypothetical protein